MTKKLFLSLTLLFCCQAYVNAMELAHKKNIQTQKTLMIALVDHKNSNNKYIEWLIKNGADPSREITVKKNEIKENEDYLLFDRVIKTTPLNEGLSNENISIEITTLLIKNAKMVGVPYCHTVKYAKKNSLLTGVAVDTRKDQIHALIGGQKSVEKKIFFIKIMEKSGFNICSTNAHHIDHKKGQGPKDRYCKKESALHTLCNIDYPDENNWKIANVLIGSNVNANHMDSNGNTPAHILAIQFLWLITNPKRHSIKNVKVYTADEYKTIFKNIVNELLKGGANLDLKNNKKQTPAKISENLNYFFKLFSTNYDSL